MTTFTLTERQLRAGSHDGLIEYTVGLQHTANTLIERLEQISALIDTAYAELGSVPAGTNTLAIAALRGDTEHPAALSALDAEQLRLAGKTSW